jgi:hypothetical protein
MKPRLQGKHRFETNTRPLEGENHSHIHRNMTGVCSPAVIAAD